MRLALRAPRNWWGIRAWERACTTAGRNTFRNGHLHQHASAGVTKSGRKELRWALVEAAWRAIRISPYWKEQYEKYLRRMRKPNQAIVVIARKLLVAVWHVLTKEE